MSGVGLWFRAITYIQFRRMKTTTHRDVMEIHVKMIHVLGITYI